MTKYLSNGDEIREDDLRAEFKKGRVRLCHSHGDGKAITGVIITDEDHDTRGECYAMYEESWTTEPKTFGHVLKYC